MPILIPLPSLSSSLFPLHPYPNLIPIPLLFIVILILTCIHHLYPHPYPCPLTIFSPSLHFQFRYHLPNFSFGVVYCMLQEDNYAGKCILNAIKRHPKNLEVFITDSSRQIRTSYSGCSASKHPGYEIGQIHHSKSCSKWLQVEMCIFNTIIKEAV